MLFFKILINYEQIYAYFLDHPVELQNRNTYPAELQNLIPKSYIITINWEP